VSEPSDVRERCERMLREHAPHVLAAVARRYGDFDAAEDAVQDALIAASTQWLDDGIPDNPRGWLYHVAIRRLTDRARSERARRLREERVADDVANAVMETPDAVDGGVATDHDDTLVLLFMCCHPSLTPPSAIALTLRAVGGLTTAEIASAFLVPEATMAQRISRAKQSISASGVSFQLPNTNERSERLAAVLHVLYLMFNEGYTSTTGSSLHRTDLSNEAIRLTRALDAALPHTGEVAGLLALMLLTDARREARTGPNGELIPLDEQDRSRWDRAQIIEGTELVTKALSYGAAGFYQLQAAIAAIHDDATHVDETDWPQILALYGLLVRMADNPMIMLSHAIASAMVHGPAAGLALLEALDADPRLRGSHRLDAVRAHLFEKSGDAERAIAHYRAAAEHTASIPERNYLITKASRLSTSHG